MWKTRFPADPYLGEVSFTDAALGTLFDRLSIAAAADTDDRHERWTSQMTSHTI
jgi:hypothetical protein